MLFASFTYLLAFLPIVVAVCVVLRRFYGPLAAQLWVLAASIFFFGQSKPSNLLYLAASIAVNWLFARKIEVAKEPVRKRLLVVALALNLAYLCTFKYLVFFAGVLKFALPQGFVVPRLPFPLGISFFTITQIMYLVDCYQDVLKSGTLLDHATFVSFFPYVISGPLAKSERMRHQFGNFGGADGKVAANLSRGLYHFSLGLFKKTVYADSFARVANYGFLTVPAMSALETWFFTVAYALQLYYDFSGYTDMAIGTAMMIGIDIPRNFDAPYRAKSIIDFWQRWHISLTQFIQSYLFTPILLGLKDKTLLSLNLLYASMFCTLLSMAIAGLWHGAAMTFVIYGLLHGVYLATNQFWRKKKLPKPPGIVSWALTLTAVLVSFTFFRAATVQEAVERLRMMVNPHGALSIQHIGGLVGEGLSWQVFGLPLLMGAVLAFYGNSSEQSAREFQPTVWNSVLTVGMVLVSMLFLNSAIPAPFVYFKF